MVKEKGEKGDNDERLRFCMKKAWRGTLNLPKKKKKRLNIGLAVVSNHVQTLKLVI